MAKKTVKSAVKQPSATIGVTDCLAGMQKLKAGCVDLCVCDPPYNLDRKYENYDDRRPRDEYLAWANRWLVQIHRVLHAHGSFWLFMHDSLVSEMDVLCKQIGFHKRSHVIWAFTFGVNCAKNFTRAHIHLLYYTKTKTRFTFNWEDPANRVPSARQLVYGDKRANVKGRLPDDVWILRPGELKACFSGHSDVWLQSRICGTFRERCKGIDNQIPLPVMERIIRTCSNAGDVVLDPVMGTGSTLCAAAMLRRNSYGFDVSPNAVRVARGRLHKCDVDIKDWKPPSSRT